MGHKLGRQTGSLDRPAQTLYKYIYINKIKAILITTVSGSLLFIAV